MPSPAKPSNVVPTVDANNKITLTWDYDPTWFSFDGNDADGAGFNDGRWISSTNNVDYFEVEMSRDGNGYVDPSGGPASITDDDSTSYSITYTPNSDTSYYKQIGIDSQFKFRIRSVNVDGSSNWVTSNTVYTDPIPPHNPSVSRPDANTIEVTWQHKSDTANITKIRVREDTGSGYGSWANFRNVTPSNESTTINVGDVGNWDPLEIKEDARYQIKLESQDNKPSGNFNTSTEVYADYGNNGNVYFEDDFESGSLSKWGGSTSNSTVTNTSNSTANISGADEGTYYGEIAAGDYLRYDLGDLSGESDVLVKCVLATGSNTSSSDVCIEYEDDTGSWNRLYDPDWSYNQQGWWEVGVRVPDSYLGANRIQIVAASDAPVMVDRVVVSDVLHEYTKPTAPTNPMTDASVDRELTLDWTDNKSLSNGSPEWFHRIYGSGNSFTKESHNPPHTWTGLLDGEKYEWYPSIVYPQPRNGNVDKWWRANGPTDTGTTNLPTPSISVSTTSTSQLDIDITDNANNEDDYLLHWREVDGVWENLSLGVDLSSYQLTGLSQNTEYEMYLEVETEYVSNNSGTKYQFTYLNGSRDTSSHSSLLDSNSRGVVALIEEVQSSMAGTEASSTRGGLNYESRSPELSMVPAMDSGSIAIIDVSHSVDSNSGPFRSWAYNERISLELIDQNVTWNDDEAVWYTPWTSETKILGDEDTLGIRSLIVPNAKNPAATVIVQYSGKGGSGIDAESEPLRLGDDQRVQKVRGVPVSEDGEYRLKIMEYSGYNSIYKIDIAIIH